MNNSHEKTKKILKIVGLILLGIGAVFTLIGFIDFFTADGMPKKFWCLFVGLPCLAFGGMITLVAHQRELARYAKNESVPVVNEAAEELRPAVKSVVSAAKEGLDEDFVLCSCGEKNDKDSKFCKACGKAFEKVCPTCGKTTDSDGKYCNHCGNEL